MGTALMAYLVQAVMTVRGTSYRRTTAYPHIFARSIKKTTAYHPHVNGVTERRNNTISDMLCMYVNVEHKTWGVILPYLTFVYNTAPGVTRRLTLFRFLYGRHLATMLPAMLPHLENYAHCCGHDITQTNGTAMQATTICTARTWDSSKVVFGYVNPSDGAGSLKSC